uniref:Uncharacterized protein n=1 Tax=Arundo donax TaxID=35708 RepID=A0A0A8YUX6_ARUDO
MAIFCAKIAYLYLTVTVEKTTQNYSRCTSWMILESLLILHQRSPYANLTCTPVRIMAQCLEDTPCQKSGRVI